MNCGQCPYNYVVDDSHGGYHELCVFVDSSKFLDEIEDWDACNESADAIAYFSHNHDDSCFDCYYFAMSDSDTPCDHCRLGGGEEDCWRYEYDD